MKVLITGANGLLGQKLVNLLQGEKGIDVIATSQGKRKLPSHLSGIIYACLDVTNQEEVLDACSFFKPNVIIHTAALTDVDKCETQKELCWKVNVEATENMAKAAELNNSFLLHISTDFIFDGENGPYDEESAPNPVNHYGLSKLAAENVLKSSPINWAIARTLSIYGHAPLLNRSNIILWVKNNLEKNTNIPVVDDQWRTPTLAEDLAMGCYLITKGRNTGIYNISGKELLTPYQMALETANYFNLNPEFIQRVNSSIFKQVARRPPRTGLIIAKAEKMLGYRPHTFSEGINIMAQQLEGVKI
ncbi:MAG: SDR family oxidoreductase [Bacteroidota bacterium]|nr:SDR family oxidoreductase [Bacteroidota bacterium]